MDNMQPPRKPVWRTPAGAFMLVAGLVGVHYLVTEHLTHAAQAVPYLFLLACPLMHLIGHRHAGHRQRGQDCPEKP